MKVGESMCRPRANTKFLHTLAWNRALLTADGKFTYTPKAGYVGTDTFTYKISRGSDTSPEATVTILVK